MIDYYETKSQPITRAIVIKAYRKVKLNHGSGGIDGIEWEDLDKDLNRQLYKLWNRMSSGSYFPPPVKEVEIDKKDGGVRKLGIPTILDRIAQGGVISPLLANIFMHVVFDKWMEIHHPDKLFVRYADDLVVHCKTEKQAQYVLSILRKRFAECGLSVHPKKTKIVNMRGITTAKYPEALTSSDLHSNHTGLRPQEGSNFFPISSSAKNP